MKQHSLFTLIIMAMLLVSCEKFVDTPLPSNKIPTEVALSSDASLVAALNGAYASVLNASGSLVYNANLFSDDMLLSNAVTINLQAQENTYDDAVDFGFFTNYYKAVYNTNLILEALNKPNGVKPEIASQVKGECLFLRAFSYYRLTSLHGDVPLVLTSDVTVSAKIGNTPVAQTWEAMINDLKAAKMLLTPEYPSADRVRANRHTASALLTRYYMLAKDWASAELEATEVINATTLYSMPDDLNTVFLKGSTETIWQLWNESGYTSVGQTYIPNPATTVFNQLRAGLVNAFDSADKRRTAWMKAGTGAASGDYYPYKYKQRAATSGANAEYLVQFRLAEMYLNRAEARARLNKLSDGLQDVNVVHERANALPLTASSQSDLFVKIEQERRLELMTEEGMRWFDLNRTGRTSFWISPIKPTFTTKAVLIPYHISILYANPNLIQNDGY